MFGLQKGSAWGLYAVSADLPSDRHENDETADKWLLHHLVLLLQSWRRPSHRVSTKQTEKIDGAIRGRESRTPQKLLCPVKDSTDARLKSKKTVLINRSGDGHQPSA